MEEYVVEGCDGLSEIIPFLEWKARGCPMPELWNCIKVT